MSMLAAIASLKKTFDDYAGKEGDKKTLTKKELATLLKNELKMEEGGNQDQIGKFFKSLDADGDGVIDFNEYVVFVATLAMFFNDA